MIESKLSSDYKGDRCVLTELILLLLILGLTESVSLQEKRLVFFVVVKNSRPPLNCLIQMSSACLADYSTPLSPMLGAAFPF